MPRRGPPGVQVLVAVGVLLLFIYGYYSYNELKSTLRKHEEAAKRMSLNEENLMTQLQVLNEQRNQFELLIKTDKENSKKEKDDFLRIKSDLELTCQQEKNKLGQNIETINAELIALRADRETLQALQQKFEVCELEKTRLENEIRRVQQESSNEVAVLRDQVADSKRQNEALKEHIKRKTIETSKVSNGGKKLRNSAHGDNVAANVIPKDDSKQQQEQVKNDDNHIPQLNDNNAQNAENGEEKIEDRMQIRGPDEDKKPAYFVPKSAKPDHAIDVVPPAAANDNVAVNANAQPNFPEQVVPPRVEAGNRVETRNKLPQQLPPQVDVQEQANAVRERDPERFRRGAKVRANAGNKFIRQVNPVLPVDEGRDQDRQERGEDGGLDAKESNGVRQWGAVRGQANAARGQVEKPLGIAVPQLNREEDQLQGPAEPNPRDGNEKDEGRENAEENDEDYQYEEKKVQRKNAIDGPHAAPVEEDDLAEGGLR